MHTPETAEVGQEDSAPLVFWCRTEWLQAGVCYQEQRRREHSEKEGQLLVSLAFQGDQA